MKSVIAAALIATTLFASNASAQMFGGSKTWLPALNCQTMEGEVFKIQIEDTMNPYKDMRISGLANDDLNGTVRVSGPTGSALCLDCGSSEEPTVLSNDPYPRKVENLVEIKLEGATASGVIRGTKYNCTL